MAQWVSYEEKESDVNIAISLVEDAALDRFDVALLISGDSDLCPALKAAKRLRPSMRIIAAFPPLRGSDPIRRLVDRTLHIDRTTLRHCQLPDEVMTGNGIKLSRPGYWS
jgi:NYN domain